MDHTKIIQVKVGIGSTGDYQWVCSVAIKFSPLMIDADTVESVCARAQTELVKHVARELNKVKVN